MADQLSVGWLVKIRTNWQQIERTPIDHIGLALWLVNDTPPHSRALRLDPLTGFQLKPDITSSVIDLVFGFSEIVTTIND